MNADTAVCATPALRDHAFRLWAEAMRSHGLSEAGFAEPECFWRKAAAVVIRAMR